MYMVTCHLYEITISREHTAYIFVQVVIPSSMSKLLHRGPHSITLNILERFITSINTLLRFLSAL